MQTITLWIKPYVLMFQVYQLNYKLITINYKLKKPRLIAESGLHSMKGGGFLLSRIALQYHRRRQA